MVEGPGKYDDLATYVREEAGAKAVILIILDGNKGSGFAVQSERMDTIQSIPSLLRSVADEIENSLLDQFKGGEE